MIEIEKLKRHVKEILSRVEVIVRGLITIATKVQVFLGFCELAIHEGENFVATIYRCLKSSHLGGQIAKLGIHVVYSILQL